MTWKTVQLPLFEDTMYTYNINLENDQFSFTFRWNEVSACWYFDITDINDDEVVSGISMVIQYPMCNHLNLIKHGLTGHFVILPNSNTKNRDVSSQNTIPQFYSMFYVYEVD